MTYKYKYIEMGEEGRDQKREWYLEMITRTIKEETKGVRLVKILAGIYAYENVNVSMIKLF